MSDKKQTAIEWLINELKTSKHYQRVINEVNQSSTDVKDVIKQARAMMMEQVKDAYGDGINGHRNEFCDRDEYFVKTFGDVS